MMRRRVLNKLAVWLSVFAILSAIVYSEPSDSASASTSTLSPVADVDVYVPNSNPSNGAATLLAVKNDPNYGNEAFFKFDISSITEEIASVKFRIYGSSNTPFDIAVYGVDTDTWLENDVTYSNRPLASTAALDTNNVGTAQYYEYDVTSYVSSQTDGTVSLVLKGVQKYIRAFFNSRENSSNRPELVVETVPPDGWTPITTSPDTRIVYVSSSEGNDTNDGLTESTPVKTIVHGATLVRDGFPDHLLLKTGDVWIDESLGRFKSGRSPEEPIVIGYYGTSPIRPKVKMSNYFIDHNGQSRNYLTITGIEFVAYKKDPMDPAFNGTTGGGFRFVGGGDHILLEDVKLEYAGIILQSYGTGVYSNFSLRRSIIADAYALNSSTTNARAAGIFAYNVDGLLIEENIFDHNGWSEVVSTAGANMFSHNIYLAAENVGNNVVVKGNIISRGASHGVHGRPGGLYEDNLIVNNSIGLQMGYSSTPLPAGTFATARNNVILDGKRMDPLKSTYPQTSAVWGLNLDNLGAGTVTLEGNIVANRKESGSNMGISNNSLATYLNNIQYNWYAGTSTNSLHDMSDPTWLDPERSVGSYNATIGGTATLDAFLTAARNRGLHEWPNEFSANAVNNYIREGFNVAPVN